MTEIEPLTAISEIEKLPFSKSWQSTYISKKQQILNIETKKLESRELNDFLYIPAPNLVRAYGSDPQFLAFRLDHKKHPDWDYKLIKDKTDNEQRRLAIYYVSRFFNAAKIKFMIDESYGIFIEIEELAFLAKQNPEKYRDLYLHLSIPKSIGKKSGIVEEWGA